MKKLYTYPELTAEEIRLIDTISASGEPVTSDSVNTDVNEDSSVDFGDF